MSTPTIRYTLEDYDSVEAAMLLEAVKAIWRHTEKHTTYVEGVGYTSRSDQQHCQDPAEHARLAAAEGKAWHDYREQRPAGMRWLWRIMDWIGFGCRCQHCR